MTKEEILAMEAGGDLDALVAKEITEECYHTHWTEDGKDSIDCLKCGQSRFYHQHSQNYSTDISAAWQVAVKAGLAIFPLNNGDWAACKASHIYHLEVAQDHYTDPSMVVCYTAPEAICKAALLAKLEASHS